MELTAFQKSVIDSILAGKVTSVESFMIEHCNLAHRPNTGPNVLVRGGSMIQTGATVWVSGDESTTHSRLTEFMLLCSKLESEGLLLRIATEPRPPLPVFRQSDNPAAMEPIYTIWSIQKDYLSAEIVPSPELSNFVHRGYLTVEEETRKNEAEDRKAAQRLTKRIAYVSIWVSAGISVMTSVGTAIFNYATYTKERGVLITNTNAFPQPQRVLLLNPPTTIVTNVINVGTEPTAPSSSVQQTSTQQK